MAAKPPMRGAEVYTDEAGDTGFILDRPYLNGGSSRFLTIAAVVMPPAKTVLIDRLLKALYEHYGWPLDKEKKWAKMGQQSRARFVGLVNHLCRTNPDVQLKAIVANKAKVRENIRDDPAKLYNYMTKLALADSLPGYDEVTFIVDAGRRDVKQGNGLLDYLEIELRAVRKAKTRLHLKFEDSSRSAGVQLADMLAGVVQSRFEHADKLHPPLPRATILHKLYF